MTEFLLATWIVLLELAPWLLVGAFIAGVLHVLLPPSFLQRQFSGRLGVLKAVVLGVPLPLCSCGVIPVGMSLKKNGGSDGATVAFLISTPQTGVDSILVSASLLGWPFAIFKLVSAAVTGIIGGWLADLGNLTSTTDETTSESPPAITKNRLVALYQHSVEMLQSIWRWLVFGVLVSAAIEVFVPENMLSSTQAYGGLIAMLATLAISLPLYVCATASVPIAAALVASGLPVGAALVFLMAGPATNVATVGAVYRTLGLRVLVIYLTTVIAGSTFCGWLFGYLIHARVDHVSHEHTTNLWWQVCSALILLAFLARFAWQEVQDLGARHSLQKPESGTATVELTVDGMSCKNCVSKLGAVLKSDANIDAADISLDTGHVEVFGNVDKTRVCELVRQAGFQPQ